MMGSHPLHSLQIPTEILNNFIIDFQRDINSNRIKSRISSIGDLIDVLWKRNMFRKNNYDSALCEMLNYFVRLEDKEKIRQYVNDLDNDDDFTKNENQYAKLRLQNQPKCIVLSKPQNENAPKTRTHAKFLEKKSQIYKLIASEMEKWRDFGRELELSEGAIKNLDQTHRGDIKSITYQILTLAEEKYQDQITVKLCKALIEIRRRDLARQMEKLLMP